MPTFEDREKGFEAKFKVDQDQRFKVTARRNKLLGLWAAGRMGLTGAAADAYSKEVVASDFEKPGDDDVIEKVAGDLKAKGLVADTASVRKELERFATMAREQVVAESKK